MAITYTPTTNFGAKDSLPTNDPDKVIKGSEFTTEFTALQTAFSLAAPNASPTFTGTVTIPTADINGGAIDGTTIGGTTPAAASFTTVSATGNITVGGTVDGRDVAADGTKLDGIEAGADVTDTTNVTAAGALMDSELTNIAAVKALNQGVATTDSPSFAGLTATGSVSLAGASTTADITFGDNDKAVFGAGSDLSVYHDGSNSYIKEEGAGSLFVQSNGVGVIIEHTDGTNLFFADAGNQAVTLYNGGSAKLATTATGIDVTGTVTADGLTVDGDITLDTEGDKLLFETSNALLTPSIYADDDGIGNSLKITSDNGVLVRIDERDAGSGGFIVQNGSTHKNAVFVNNNGDISFYEDTGTTPKFFWDASAERLGLGTTSPSGALDIGGQHVLYDNFDALGASFTRNGTYGSVLSLGRQGVSSGVTLDYPADNTFALSTGATERMRIDSAGRVGIGTSSPSGMLTLDKDVATLYDATDDDAQRSGTTTLAITNENGTQNTFAQIAFDLAASGQSIARIVALNDGASTSALAFVTEGSNTKREVMRLNGSGNVGIGTTSPARPLTVNGLIGSRNSTTGFGTSDGFDIGVGGSDAYLVQRENANIIIETNGAERMRITSAGNVGIGTSSPSAKLHTVGSIRQTDAATETNALLVSTSGSSSTIETRYGTPLIFGTNAIERARLDASGNLLVGTTNNTLYSSTSDTGINLTPDGGLYVAADGTALPNFNRVGTDGDIMRFRKDGTTVGSIGAGNGDLVIGTADTNVRFYDGTNTIVPCSDSSGTWVDNSVDLGIAGGRFKDLYLSGGVYLGGTGAANHLDDYEEGTWTPVLSGTGYTFGAHTGTYVKIGRMVYVTALLNVTAVGTNTSFISISGYPFTSHSTTNEYHVGVARQTGTTGRLYVAQINVGTTSGGINSMDGVVSGDNEIFTTGIYSLSLTYIST